jgi:hypothetical protein
MSSSSQRRSPKNRVGARESQASSAASARSAGGIRAMVFAMVSSRPGFAIGPREEWRAAGPDHRLGASISALCGPNAARGGEKRSAPDRIRTCDLRFRRPRREFGGARLGSGFGSVSGFEFVWVRLDSVPSVALLLPSLAFRVSGSLVVSSGLALSPWSWGFPGGKNCASGRSRSGT